MVWCAEPEGRYIGPIPENGLRWIVRTAASQKVSQVAEETLKIWTAIASKSRLQRKRGAEGTRAMSTQRFMWNYVTSKNPKGQIPSDLGWTIGVGVICNYLFTRVMMD